MAQITILTTELDALRQEVVQAKANHASLHQASVDANAGSTRSFLEQGARLNTLERQIKEVSQEAQQGMT